MRTPSPTTTYSPIDASAETCAREWTTAVGCTPGAGRHCSAKTSTACAKARYGFFARSIAHGAASASSPRMTAPAFVARSAGAYLLLAKKVTSRGPADSIPATRSMSMVPSPSRRQPRRSARFLSCILYASPLRAAKNDPLKETGQVVEAEMRRDPLHDLE